MAKSITFVAVLVGAERLLSSKAGNPRWQLVMDGAGTSETAADYSINYEVENRTGGPGSWIGKRVEFTTEGGRVTGWRLAAE